MVGIDFLLSEEERKGRGQGCVGGGGGLARRGPGVSGHVITCDLALSAVSVPLNLLVELAAGTGCEQEVGHLGAACTGKGSAERAQTWLCT